MDERLINRAASLSERLSGDFVPMAADSVADQLWKQWSQALSKDDPNVLLRRLGLFGIDPDKARALLGEAERSAAAAIPGWAEICEAATRVRIDSFETEENWNTFHGSFLTVARERLRDSAKQGLARLSEQALNDLCDALRNRLQAIYGRVLDVEFSIAQAAGLARNEFACDYLVNGGFLRDYPAASRLAGLAVLFWVESITEFLRHLEADSAELQILFGEWVNSSIAHVKAAISDPHRRGRGVLILTYPDGAKLVYKPRSVGLELKWFEFGLWLNARECPVRWKELRVLDRRTYGWMEFVTHEECCDENEVRLYFERSGGLLALLHVLAGADMHYENLIANGAYPVPIDLEVLMAGHRGNPDSEAAGSANEEAADLIRHSVLNIGMLPSWASGGKGKVFNLGGLGASEKSAPSGSQLHRPFLNGAPISSHLHRASIIQGFRETYQFLLRYRDEILSEDGPLAAFRGEPTRFVNRATSVYARTLRRASSPAVLASGVVRSFEFEPFMKSVLHVPVHATGEVLAITQAEVAAMEQGDIPFFQGRVDSCDLPIPETGTVLPRFFTKDGFSISHHRFEALSPENLELQTKLIRLSFDLMGDDPIPEESRVSPIALASPSFVDEAFALASSIRADAMTSGGSAAWIAPQMLPGTESFCLQVAGNSFYDGSLGVMLFLLAMEAVLDDKASGRLGRQVFASFQRHLARPVGRLVLKQQPLGLQGFGGQIHALLASAQLAGDHDMAEAALDLGSLLTEQSILRYKDHDVMIGFAGVIPSLLALHSLAGETEWLHKAVACGDQMLALRRDTGNGLRSWKSFENFLAGYSHGAAGCAASLMQLHAVSGEDRFREAAVEAIAYENTLYDSEAENWRDLRFENSFMASWCHGAPGILLGRLSGRDRDTEDISRAISGTLRAGAGPVDQCCCGSSGRASILLTASELLGVSALKDAALGVMTQSISQARVLGGYRCYGKLPRTVRGPGFFQGYSGIGYTLLRMEFPRKLPCALVMLESVEQSNRQF